MKIHSIVIEKSLSEGFFSGDRKKSYRFRDIHVQGKYSKHNFNQKSLKHKYVKKRENNGMRTGEERGYRIDSYLHLRERETDPCCYVISLIESNVIVIPENEEEEIQCSAPREEVMKDHKQTHTNLLI